MGFVKGDVLKFDSGGTADCLDRSSGLGVLLRAAGDDQRILDLADLLDRVAMVPVGDFVEAVQDGKDQVVVDETIDPSFPGGYCWLIGNPVDLGV